MPGAVKHIGIGVADDAEKVIASIRELNGCCDVTCYCRPGTVKLPIGAGHIFLSEHDAPEQAMAGDLAAGAIDAAVRGTLPSNSTLRALKVAMRVDRLERIALLETPGGIKFFLAPVGVDEGWTVDEKVALVKKGREICTKFGLPDKAGILSGGRLGDIGRHERVDASIRDAQEVARLAGADHVEILIEDAVRSCGLIIAPDGISGNLIFRTLVLLGGGKGHGAPVVNISRIFVDTSRASPDYTNALLLAVSLLE
jgi:putative methanogen marker protein 4